MAEERLGIGRACPRCGVRGDTLGTVCPACRKPYAAKGLLDHIPLLVLVGLALTAVLIWLISTHLVAGIIVAGASFALLVAAVGLTNALAERAVGQPPRPREPRTRWR